MITLIKYLSGGNSMFLNKNSQDIEDRKKVHNPIKHMGMMGVCCLLPLLIISILPLLKISNLGTNILISGISSLICPIMMVVMMIVMFRNGKKNSCCSDEVKKEVSIENK